MRMKGTLIDASMMDRRSRHSQRNDKKRGLGKPAQAVVLAVLLLTAIVLLSGAAGIGANAHANTITFTGDELLGKPTNNSIAVNIVPASAIEYYYQYGTTSGVYLWQTPPVTAAAGQPHEAVITGLNPNTRYYYRMVYDGDGDVEDGDSEVRSEHSFRTQRAEGAAFTFTVTSDIHGVAPTNAMSNILNEFPDFHIDLGDTFMVDNTTTQAAVNTQYLAFREPTHFDKIGGSVPIFLSSGNHENEEGWNFDDTFSIAQASVQARKLFYPTPISDGFYSGNTDILAAINAATYGDQYRENYYAWTWGDALFVVIDPFQYTMNLPYTPTAGEGSEPVTGDQWSWTLGAQQFNWLRTTLANSDAKYKFMFSHQMVGGVPYNASGGAGYVRGGAEAAGYFEWGGKNTDGSAGFAAHRNPVEFGTRTIQQLMVDYGVSAYFHGHDHQYVHETRDGIHYQELSSGNMTAFGGIYKNVGTWTDYSGVGTFSVISKSTTPGHIRVEITSAQATVQYISNATGAAIDSLTYTIASNTSGPTHTLTMAVSPSGGGTTDPSVGTHTYDEGTPVTITANPAEGYVFDSWTGDVADPDAATTTVTMGSDKSVTAIFTVGSNDPPLVSGIPDQTITEGQSFTTITLDNYVSDPDNTDAQMTWSYSGNSQLSVSIVNRVATITTPSPDWNGAETITFRATDPGSLWDDDAATFTVTGSNDPPQITSNGGGATAAVYAAENQTAVTDVNATDANGDTLTYSISGGADQAKFSIVPATGVLTFLSAPDFENPTDAGANNVYDVTVQVSDGALTDTQAIAVTVTDVADTTPPVLTFTSPSGLGSYTTAQTVPVNWSSSLDLDAGQFGVWARSAAGTWYVGQLAPTNAGDDVLTYSADLALSTVPVGFYQVIVGYRPTVGSGAWTAFATSYGFVFEVGDAPTPAVTITAPAGQGSYASADSFTATWTASPSLTTGQFAVWVRSPGGTWYWKQPLIPATGAASYSTTVSLSGTTPGLGYQVIVAYEPIANTSQWVSWATSPGVFSVDATAPTINISQPSGTGSYSTSQSVTATWTTNQTLTGGQFGVWVRSGAGGYYVTTLVSATGAASTVYSTALPLAGVPTGSNNQVIIAYRPVAGTGAFMSWATSPGSFTITP